MTMHVYATKATPYPFYSGMGQAWLNLDIYLEILYNNFTLHTTGN